MPTGPKGQKPPRGRDRQRRPRHEESPRARLRTGVPIDDGKDPAAKAMGAKGGAARAKNYDS